MKLKIFYLFLTIFSSYSLAEEIEPVVEVKQEGDANEENFIHESKIATIQVLNKITAKVKNMDIEVNSSIDYGSLRIEVKYCWKSSPYEATENKVLMNIADKKPGQNNYQQIFSGWMFSSGPGVSTLEHAVYDITVISCKN